VASAFIVEGQMEQRIVQRACPGTPVRRIQCNGDHVSLDRLCDFIETQVRLLVNRYYPIVVVFDREGRAESPKQIQAFILDRFAKAGMSAQDIRVYVADRETEDWYLMDIEAICQHYDVRSRGRDYRGKGGLSALLEPVHRYHETTIGVDIFFKISKAKVAKCCPMFSALRNTALQIGCDAFN
jgi:hypothetical protein